MSRRARRRAAVALAALLGPWCAFLIADAVDPLPRQALEPAPARLVTAHDGRPLRIFLPEDGRYRLPASLEEISPAMLRTIVASEDRWFRWHPGVNPLAVVRATLANLRAGEVVSGASTITMQIARLIEPKPRTLGGKLHEAFRALQLEWHHDKEALLETYLNLTPYGGNLQGVGAAAWFYFGKRPAQLSLGEAALLTVIPRSPVRYDPVRAPERAERARRLVIDQLHDRGAIDAEERADALLQPLPDRVRPAPFEAPHMARLAAVRAPRGRAEVRSTLDLDLQRTVAARAGAYIETLRRQGIGNVAVVVEEIETRAVRALVGSDDFFDVAHGGQLNAAVAERSPGSTLKPFLYALAIDRGLIVPDSWVLDVPTDFSGYVAENYDGEYRGRVTASTALAQSLNAPAVRLLSRVGLEPFLATLRSGGLGTLDRSPLHYGLPLVLGAGEVRLLDLVNLYASMADGGRHAEFRLLEEEPRDPEPRRLVSPEAAELVTRVLAEVERPDMPEAWRLTRDVPAVAWKTGTSYGHRDAWAVGFSRRYAIGVWVGNLDGRGERGISGARHAGPLLFDLFRAVEGNGSRLPHRRDLDLVPTRVCALSHEVPGPFCPTTTMLTIPGTTRLSRCAMHRRIFVDAATGEQVAGECLRDRAHRPVLLTVEPAEMVAWMIARGQQVNAVPPLSAGCGAIPDRDPPRIVSPDAATPYVVRRDAPAEHQRIALTARVAADVRRLYWYQDGELVGAAGVGEPVFVAARPGSHRLVVVDDTGRSHAVSYRVQDGG